MGHDNAEGMAHVGAHVERTVRLAIDDSAVDLLMDFTIRVNSR